MHRLIRVALGVLMLAGVPALAQATPPLVSGPNKCDFDGDGKTDAVIVRNNGSQSQWWIYRSTLGIMVVDWGLSTDIKLCGDFDGDGKSDVTVWTPGAAGVARFQILQSSNGLPLVELFGQTGDDPLGGDYDGDGRDDFAVYRAGTSGAPQSYLFYRTTPGGAVSYVPWGAFGDVSAPFDFDGDSKLDPMVKRFGQIWIRQSSNGATVLRNFGLASDLLVVGKWDGDTTEDQGAGRSGQLWTLGSTTNTVGFRNWGISTDVVIQGDWDGDGLTDMAIRRPSTGEFWISRSTGGLAVFQWGVSTDTAVNSYRVK